MNYDLADKRGTKAVISWRSVRRSRSREAGLQIEASLCARDKIEHASSEDCTQQLRDDVAPIESSVTKTAQANGSPPRVEPGRTGSAECGRDADGRRRNDRTREFPDLPEVRAQLDGLFADPTIPASRLAIPPAMLLMIME